MMDTMHESSIGNMRDICGSTIDQAAPPVPHHPASSGVADEQLGYSPVPRTRARRVRQICRWLLVRDLAGQEPREYYFRAAGYTGLKGKGGVGEKGT